MSLENFISRALCNPTDFISYDVSRRLAELYPEKLIVEGSTSLFGLEAFVHAKQCSLVEHESVHNQIKTMWGGMNNELFKVAENALFNIIWQDQILDVVLMTWSDDGCKSRYHWIIADTKEVAEAFFRSVCQWCTEVRGEILVFDGGDWRKSEELFLSIKGASFDNLILPGNLKEEIQNDFANFFLSRDMYNRYGIPWKRGVLFIGPPGNGKTHTVKALVNQLKYPCLYVKSFKSRYDTEHDNIRAVFARARQTTPSIVVLEDLDSLIDGKNRSFFLNELDGFASNTGILVVATTNHPEKLDPAILDRPSRFDRKYYFDLPDGPERLAYVEAWNNSLQAELRLSESIIAETVTRCEGFSFAYLKELFLSAMIEWASSQRPALMDAIIMSRADVLSRQMSSMVEDPSSDPSDDED